MFLPYHRASLAKAGMPKQNGETHAAAGDIRSQEASFVLKTNDPAGFTIVDVRWARLGWRGMRARGWQAEGLRLYPQRERGGDGGGALLVRRELLLPLTYPAPVAVLGCR